MRLDHLLERSGYSSKKERKQLLARRCITVDGQIATSIGQNVDAKWQDIRVGERRLIDDSQVYYLLNKPKGYVTAVSDPKMPTVLDLIQDADQRPNLYHIGRLDADTEGLLLITNNGPLGLRMLHPKHHVSKTYLVTVNGLLDSQSVGQFAQGITFHDGTICKPAQLQIIESSPTSGTALVTIVEGRFHQVKKMFLAIGVKVTYLKRISFGPIVLEDELAIGHYRHLTPEEMSKLLTFFDSGEIF